MRLVATKEFSYGGKLLKPGAPFEASDRDAKLLKLIKKAEDGPTVAPVAMPFAPVASESVTETEQPMPSRRRYTRRDMRASEED